MQLNLRALQPGSNTALQSLYLVELFTHMVQLMVCEDGISEDGKLFAKGDLPS